ncbi:MAG: helix-turn-helix domain-containing protein [Vampirovibrionales bacterium]
MPKSYQHLTKEQRYLICTLKSRANSHRSIAKLMGVSSGIVDREVSFF